MKREQGRGKCEDQPNSYTSSGVFPVAEARGVGKEAAKSGGGRSSRLAWLLLRQGTHQQDTGMFLA